MTGVVFRMPTNVFDGFAQAHVLGYLDLRVLRVDEFTNCGLAEKDHFYSLAVNFDIEDFFFFAIDGHFLLSHCAASGFDFAQSALHSSRRVIHGRINPDFDVALRQGKFALLAFVFYIVDWEWRVISCN
jgi:hypothetical protein